ncbi:hypothetical protein B296_00055429 [Ensete ventricosum]|uniref:Uncharacterized protein n=1 Tax=Ensete ventricosum TaxID=4639 RepID=A0A426WX85_ENSVE|nr:hypothetical protein B296_00055429 [Ensete ventricosum]
MLHLGVTQEWVDEGELPREQQKNRRWQRPYDVGGSSCVHWMKALVISIWGLYTTKEDVQVQNCYENIVVLKQVVESDEEVTTSPVGLSYPKVKHRLERRWTQRSTTVPQRQIYWLRRKGCRCKTTYSRAMGLAAPWYRRGRTSMESSIPCSHGGRALVVKGAKEVENAKATSKYQDRAEGQMPRNFIRPMSMGFSSR